MILGQPTLGRARRVAFFSLALFLSLLVTFTFVAVTALTIGMWVANQNPVTTPVSHLAFFSLGAILVGFGLTVQLWTPERHVAGMQQALIGLGALTLAGFI